jgi:peptidoglycan/LPS O-acetylase OafA/YrhL
MTTTKPSYWIASIEPLRGIAALMVVCCHIIERYTGLAAPIYDFAEWLGAAGVGLFFIISGFCIHLPYVKTGTLDLKNFYFRRFYRLVPTHYAALICAILVAIWLPNAHFMSQPTIGNTVSQFLFVHNFNYNFFYSINSAFWTIGVEVHFYLIYPIAILIAHRIGMMRLFGLSVLFSLVFYGLCSKYLADEARFVCQHLFVVYYYQWLLGALCVEYYFKVQADGKQSNWLTTPLKWLVIVAGTMLYCYLYLADFVVAKLHIVQYIAPFILVFILYAVVQLKTIPSALFNGLGKISYSLYLIHIPILAISSYYFPVANFGLYFALSLSLILIGTVGFYYLFERFFQDKNTPLFLKYNRLFTTTKVVKTI